MSPAPPQLSTRRKAIYMGVLLLGAVMACEATLRVRAWIRYGGGTPVRDALMVFDPDAGIYVPKPGYQVRGSQMNVRINSLGFRGDEFAETKPASTLRIAVLGASTTFNAEVSSNEKTWPHRLQEKLRAAHPRVKIEVINTALGGYVSTDNLKNLRARVLRLDPDLVIYYEANNEIVHDTAELARERGLIATNTRSPLVSTLARLSLVFDLASKNAAIVLGPRGGPSEKIDAVPADLPRHFISVLDEMRQELSSRGIVFMLSTFIVKYRPDQDRATQVANADVAFYYMPWMSIDGMLQAMQTYNQAILDFAKRNALPVVDDRESIPPDALHFADCMHVRDLGAEAMADRFFRYFQAEHVIERLAMKLERVPEKS